MLGPAFVAAIAYVDPGNVATNLTAGATLGYTLVWVVVAASLVAILVQFQAAKLGMATGLSLSELCNRSFSKWGNRMLRLDCALALGVATVINVSMIALGAGLGAATDGAWTGDLLAAHAELADRIGGAAALAFAVALLSSGVSSAGIGTLAGDIVMQGFLGWRVPVHVRRIVTMAPAILALLSGASLTGLLVLSQVAISLGVPVALFLLVYFCRDRTLMGPLVNAPLTTWIAAGAGAVVALLACSLPLTLLF